MLTTLRLEMLSGVLPRFVSVTVFKELLPTSCAPKLRDVAERLTAVPVPLKLTVCVLPATPLLLSVMVSVPVSGPVAVGEKLTLIVQEPLAATLPPQLLVWPKLALVAMLVMVSATLPVLFRVTGCDPLVVPRFWLPNVRLVGETPATGAAPVPVKLTVCGLSEALSVKFSEALRLPIADGVNVTLTVQAPLGVTVAPVQVSALLAKSLAFVPPIVTVEMVRLAVPVLVTVSAWAALVVLMG